MKAHVLPTHRTPLPTISNSTPLPRLGGAHGANTSLNRLRHLDTCASSSVHASSPTLPLARAFSSDGRAANTGCFVSAIRHASWFVQTRPSAGVFSVCAGSDSASPQPVNQRCWWSRARGSGERRSVGSIWCWEGCGVFVWLFVFVEVVRDTGVEVGGGWVKRSATWFATTMAMLCVRARSRSRAPSWTSWVPRFAREATLFGFSPFLSNSAR
ncbi:hypothetical protein P153DRAFT_32731 [Dothidotthia symphoricarpi CBS 119687]|uniref:Uncharacterized protein n=1 Tax=Dothidotthia symphoricarpi CBS 119687 TaxID=1392245 RepID=A0A6A6AE02_9PLEO|nr:uncharacterized protein P153DRAFT_32731 [Dothidotthia symphoricarpi CBS 119687]KAF2129127.1 hypothetical protein P153DRAFT_32731 [Dothidotthia symphoricarpi CBS 119687]